MGSEGGEGGGKSSFEKLRWKEGGGGSKNCAFRKGCVESSGITHSYLYATIIGVVITLVDTVNMQ